MKRQTLACFVTLLTLVAGPSHAAGKEQAKAWTDPEVARREDPDFSIQGEYGSDKVNAATGVQVVALGNGQFDAYLLQDGLPGLGWTRGKTRTVMKGKREGDQVTFTSSDKKISASVHGGHFILTNEDGTKSTLPRITRSSATLGVKPPSGALVLFDGTSTEQWENAKMENGYLLSTGCSSKQHFGDYTLHLEFRTPYMPTARGQRRGNSGVYHSGRWETQVLDSFGLDGKDNECGGIYSISEPRLNMCLPPLTWQTYDVDFTAAKFDAGGKRTAWPRITVKLNGVIVHENLELAKDFTTSAPINQPLTTPKGPVHLQNHGNPVVYRNIWIAAVPPANPAPDGFVAVFDGTSLKGWEGDAAYWSVEDGAITGKTDGSLQMNRFLTWKGFPVRNFELQVKVKISPGGNSGLQYRGKMCPEIGPDIVAGYQCDIVAGTPKYHGMIYEERGRRILSHTGEKVTIAPDGKPWITGNMEVKTFASDEWQDFRVLVRGNHHQHWVNGHPTADLIDLDEKGRALEGVLAVQVHVGPAMKVQFKDFKIKLLPDDLPLQSAEANPIPRGSPGVRPQAKLPADWKPPLYGEP